MDRKQFAIKTPRGIVTSGTYDTATEARAWAHKNYYGRLEGFEFVEVDENGKELNPKPEKPKPRLNKQGNIGVFFRFNRGVITKKVFIDPHWLKEFRMPVMKEMKVSVYNDAQEYITPRTGSPLLIWEWKGEEYNGVPVMELIGVRES